MYSTYRYELPIEFRAAACSLSINYFYGLIMNLYLIIECVHTLYAFFYDIVSSYCCAV